MAYAIEKGHELPVGNGAGVKSKYPFGEMEVGESFFLPYGVIGNPSSIAGMGNRAFAPKRFTGRKAEGGIRIWRVA